MSHSSRFEERRAELVAERTSLDRAWRRWERVAIAVFVIWCVVFVAWLVTLVRWLIAFQAYLTAVERHVH